jgi:ClpP class serine protease
MSRYEEALPDGRTVVFGWDPPLLTYFGQVIDPTRDEDDQIVHWVGCSPEELYEIVAVANTMAASAAYWIASQADELVVTPSGQVGSIGVLAVHQDSSKLQERIGITTTVISAGRFKAESFGPLSKAATQALQSNVDDLYDLFVADVAAGRKVSTQAVTAGYGEGRMVLAANAKPLGMVDEIATLEATIVRLGGMPSDEDQDEAVIPDPGDDDELDEDAPDQARAESGVPADRLYGEVGLNQPSWLLTD